MNVSPNSDTDSSSFLCFLGTDVGAQSFVFKQRTTDKEQKTWSLNPRSLGGKIMRSVSKIKLTIAVPIIILSISLASCDDSNQARRGGATTI